MPGYVALLRGINVGGKNKVAMADLRALAEGLGHSDVATYVQSGNLIFTAAGTDTGAMADALEREIAARTGVAAPVIVVSAVDLAGVIAGNPFPGEDNPKAVHAVFRRDDMPAKGAEAVAKATARAREDGSPDEAVIVGRTLYLHTPDGLGRSDLATRLGRSAAQSGGTARNWSTVTKLAAMLPAVPPQVAAP